MNELYYLSHGVRHINRLAPEQQLHHIDLFVEAAAPIFREEWRSLTRCDAVRMSLSTFKPEFVSSFSFNDIYESIRRCAPTLLSLIESFSPETTADALESPEAKNQQTTSPRCHQYYLSPCWPGSGYGSNIHHLLPVCEQSAQTSLYSSQ